MNVFVTGGTGFIGRHLVRKLSARGDKIFCLVRDQDKADRLLKAQNVHFFYGDITRPDTLRRLEFLEIEALYHCAGLVAFGPKSRLMDINAFGTQNICDLAIRQKVKQMVYVSSVATINGNPEVALHDRMPYKATNAYGQSKIEGEKIVLQYREKGLPVSIFRPPIVYGPEETHFLAPLLFLLNCRLLPLVEGGVAKQQMIYVENLVDVMIQSVEKKSFLQGTHLVADKEALTLREILTLLAKATEMKEPWELPNWMCKTLYVVPLLGWALKKLAKNRLVDYSSATAAGYEPRFQASENLERTARGFFKRSN